MRPALFIGPSAFGVDPEEFKGVDVLPPARCGDVYVQARNGRPAIGIVDGVFETSAAVWHKEILFALAQGIAVFGAASIGALRAAECQPFGMSGIGAIFESYACGERTSDADVALLHGPADVRYCPLTVPLVDAEDALRMLYSHGAVSAEENESLLRAARSMFYKLRTWDAVFREADLRPSRHAPLLHAIDSLGPLQKARDALALTRTLVDHSGPRADKRIQFHSTLHFDILREQYNAA